MPLPYPRLRAPASVVQKTIKLKRWIHMAAEGWYSGDTHVHRKVSEMPNLVMAEDLNVAFPLSYWVTDSTHRPSRDNKVAETRADRDASHGRRPSHLLARLTPSTKYLRFEINDTYWEPSSFSITSNRLPRARPRSGRSSRKRGQQGAILELDKHNWPWSMMLIPVADVDLFELSNNHIWRTEFLFSTWYPEYAGQYMNIEKDADGGFTEWGWIDFGFKNYYALLNCGFDIQPTGGTANGVHPVPLGFGRVYVHLEDKLDYGAWLKGLKQGRSFVTTGPMLRVTVDGQGAGRPLRAGPIVFGDQD